MMPVLWGIRDNLLKDQKEENEFSDIMARELDLMFKIDDFDLVKQLVTENISWWKDEIVKVWKRPIDKDQKSAWKMIKERTISILKKTHKKNIDYSFDNRKKTQVCKLMLGAKRRRYEFYAFGLTKDQFCQKIEEWLTQYHPYKYNESMNKAEINRNCSISNNISMIEQTKNQPKELITITL